MFTGDVIGNKQKEFFFLFFLSVLQFTSQWFDLLLLLQDRLENRSQCIKHTRDKLWERRETWKGIKITLTEKGKECVSLQEAAKWLSSRAASELQPPCWSTPNENRAAGCVWSCNQTQQRHIFKIFSLHLHLNHHKTLKFERKGQKLFISAASVLSIKSEVFQMKNFPVWQENGKEALWFIQSHYSEMHLLIVHERKFIFRWSLSSSTWDHHRLHF